MYYVQIIGIIIDNLQENSENILSRLQIIHNEQKFYINLVIKSFDKNSIKKIIQKGNKIFVSGNLIKSINKKNNIKYTNETLLVDNIELISTNKNYYNNKQYNDF